MSQEQDRKSFILFGLILAALAVLMVVLFILGGKYGGGNTPDPLNLKETPTEITASEPAQEMVKEVVMPETVAEVAEMTESASETTEASTETSVEETASETAADATASQEMVKTKATPGPAKKTTEEAAVETVADASATEEVATAAAASTGSIDGEAIYNRVCVACHAGAIPGIPKLGEKADWDARVAQGMDVLYDHAINGYMGSAMMMPPKGGGDLTDDEVKATVDYMVQSSQ